MRWLIGVWCLALCICRAAAAQQPMQDVSPTPGAPVPGAGYRFVPGDVLDVTVSSHRGLNRTITIQPDGRIQFPRAGEIAAAGLTASQLALALQEKLSVELIDPRVTIGLKELNRGLMRRVSVLGAVKSPGSFELKEGSTLAEILATAGGPTDVADLRRVTVARTDGSRKEIDLADSTRAGEVKNNAPLQPGDLILVPEGTPSTVLVLGQVARPGSYGLQGEMRLLDALSLAGGPTPRADLRRVTLTQPRRERDQIVDLQELLTKGRQKDFAANVRLEAGDVLVLPESECKFYVLGEVNKADAYPLKANDRLLDALTTAGGSTREADLTKVMLIRKDEKGEPKAQQVDLRGMMRKGAMARNELLREGDVIFVPNRKPRRPIADFLGFLYPLSGLVNVLRR